MLSLPPSARNGTVSFCTPIPVWMSTLLPCSCAPVCLIRCIPLKRARQRCFPARTTRRRSGPIRGTGRGQYRHRGALTQLLICPLWESRFCAEMTSAEAYKVLSRRIPSPLECLDHADTEIGCLTVLQCRERLEGQLLRIIELDPIPGVISPSAINHFIHSTGEIRLLHFPQYRKCCHSSEQRKQNSCNAVGSPCGATGSL